ncbi:TPD1 protein homolog 1B [Setaria viridis]|uniref:TPD1 protein homolog 1B n=1 Tax=Setaria viridis TaxID=4556 RepID=UPI0014934218|nr:TPD1 protein homolog 1B-like [Setaria viridis]
MVCFQKHAAAIVIVLSFLLLGCEANDPPSSSTVKHKKMEATVHVRKLLNLSKQHHTTAYASGHLVTMSDASPSVCACAAAVEAVTAENRWKAAAPSECSEDAVVVSQSEAGERPGDMPCYSVTITNTCVSCAVRNVRVSCGEFGSGKLVDPSDFRRVAAGNCIVRGGGGAMQPSETISFEYSTQFQYDLGVASVSCSCG